MRMNPNKCIPGNRTAKKSYGKNSVRRKFFTAKDPFGKIPYGKNSVRRNFRTAENPYGENSVPRKILRQKILRRKISRRKVLASFMVTKTRNFYFFMTINGIQPQIWAFVTLLTYKRKFDTENFDLINSNGLKYCLLLNRTLVFLEVSR